MTLYEPGDVVLVRFPFTDLSSSKRRPALILNGPKFTVRYGDVLVLALTSQPQRNVALRVNRWQAAGLPKPTWIKPILGTPATALVVRRLGTFGTADYPAVKAALRQMIVPRFFP